jgi:tRNA-splicing ligase RtcB
MHAFKKEDANVPVKIWSDEGSIEAGALVQLENASKLPFVFKHLAVMPDCHQGYGVTIGCVLAAVGTIIPNAVGVDIGCGMCAVKTSIKVEELDQFLIKKIMGRIRELVPVGFSHNAEPCNDSEMPSLDGFPKDAVVARQYLSAMKQLGTLGGGNHFIEIQRGNDGNIWIMVHSGSRNLGKQVADYYNDLAIKINEKYHSAVPKKWELAFLPYDSAEGKAYANEMDYCVEFAFANRQKMMSRIMQAFQEVLEIPGGGKILGEYPFEEKNNGMINIAHNYAAMEHHFGHNVMVHRKGATSARDGEIGIIPGSQGTKSYIVRGKGNPESFNSCSHGAGRKMGRKEASRSLNLEAEIKRLDDQGIVHGIRTEKDLDEAAGAYKDIDVVMKNQEDLVDILVELQPMAVIKG